MPRPTLSRPELLTVAAPVLERWQEARETEALDRWNEELGRNGRASSGWAVDARSRVRRAGRAPPFRDGANHDAKRCPACGRLSVDGSKCPLDGTQLDHSKDGLDLAVHQTLAHGGRVWAVRHRDDLDTGGGIGALLRF